MSDLERATTEELKATLGARRELGHEFESALVESFVARVEERVDAEVAARTAAAAAVGTAAKQEKRASEQQFVLGIVSLGTGIPITAIADNGGLAGIAIAWAGIVGVNVAHALSLRRRRG